MFSGIHTSLRKTANGLHHWSIYHSTFQLGWEYDAARVSPCSILSHAPHLGRVPPCSASSKPFSHLASQASVDAWPPRSLEESLKILRYVQSLWFCSWHLPMPRVSSSFISSSFPLFQGQCLTASPISNSLHLLFSISAVCVPHLFPHCSNSSIHWHLPSASNFIASCLPHGLATICQQGFPHESLGNINIQDLPNNKQSPIGWLLLCEGRNTSSLPDCPTSKQNTFPQSS